MLKTVLTRKWLPAVRAAGRKLDQAYRRAMRTGEKTVAQEWLCDNIYLFRRAGRDACALLRTLPRLPQGDTAPTALQQACGAAYDLPDVWSTRSLQDALSDKGLSGEEVHALEAMLRVVVLQKAAQGIGEADVMAKAVRRLRSLPDVEFDALQCALSPVERILMQDPAGAWPQMEEQSRAMVRALLFRKAAKEKTDAATLAGHVLESARAGTTDRTRHVSFYLLPRYPRARGSFFLLLEALVPLAACTFAWFFLHSAVLSLLLLLPLWGCTAGFIGRLSVRGVPPVRLLRMKMQQIPSQMQTLLTVSTILPPAAKAENLRTHLEQLYLSNGQTYIKVCLLADLKNSGTPERPEDAADVGAMQRVIDALNAQYGGGFILAIRPRVYAPTEGCFSGRERKRGAIEQLVREICGMPGGFLRLSGDTKGMENTRYLFALDGDTRLPMDAAVQMVSVAAHPLYRAVVDEKRRIVTAGYGVLAPRVCTDLSSCRTLFQRLMRADCGLTAYDSVVSERYQDLFGEGIFAGKGLIDVQAFHAVLDGALPDGCILSHDSVEGGYLRCGFVSDVQVSDGFPADVRVWLSRLGRWVRGDWQNLRFVFGRNPLSALSRWKLLDNMRRSLTDVVCLGLLFACVFLPAPPAPWLCGVCVLASSAGSFSAALHALCTRGSAALSRLFYSGTAPAALSFALQGLLRIMLLPLSGLRSGISIIQALWRSLVSHKRLLEWTTFAQTGARSSNRQIHMQCLWAAASASALFVSPHAVLRLVSLAFLCAVPFILLSGRVRSFTKPTVSYAEREKLTSYAAAMWRYFEENCTFQNNYLPPDNVQETPVFRVAQRTSPTNIGLALLCALTARDFGFIDSDRLYSLLHCMFDSIEQLETYRGNLLNWYDTRTLRPLEPQYVSTVDCGNFLCCLKTLQQGLREYAPQQPKLRQIDARIERILQSADLTALYDAQRKLFFIGLDPQTGKRSDAYYDLLMSEARMTGYYAVARRIVPKNHWAALARTMGKAGRYTGLLSWSGTAFEYFMPYLFLPAPYGTLTYEALHFCAWCQRHAAGKGRPFGVSESGFYAFDRDFNYQYKAHGIQSLALRRGTDESVVSPYASFLMLQLEPRTVLRNLHRLERMQMTGRWGFYEAIDFTAARTGGMPFACVRSYMAHHVGMSMLAVSNALHDGILRRRFMHDGEMRAAQSLLEEGVPSDAPVAKHALRRASPLPRERFEQHRREIAEASPLHPNARVWSNGEVSLCASDVGASRCVYRGVSVFVPGSDLLRMPGGPVAVLQNGEKTLPFAPMADYSRSGHYRCTFTATAVQYAASADDVQLRVQAMVHPTFPALVYTFTVHARRAWSGDLLFYAEPSLADVRESRAHPAFAKLFLEDCVDAENRAVLFRKREREGNDGVCMAAGFLQDVPHVCTRSKSMVLRSGYGIASLLRGNIRLREAAGSGDGCICVQVPLQIAARGSVTLHYVFALASTQQEALGKLLLVRDQGVRRGAGTLLADGRMETVLADKLLPGAVFGVRDAQSARLLRENPYPKQRLWQFGLSGERPVVFRQIGGTQDVASAAPFIRAVHRLHRAGFSCDLVLGYSEGGDYDAPVLHALQQEIRQICADDETDEIVLVNLRKFSDADCAFLQAVSIYTMPEREETLHTGVIRPVADASPSVKDEKLYSFTDASVIIPKINQKPYLPWSLVLSNATFGTMVSDKSLGFTWAVNAHENKLTPWTNDTASDNRGELLLLLADGVYYDLCRGATAELSPECAVWTGVAAGVTYRVTVTVPPRGAVKYCSVELRGDRQTKLFYYLEPVLGAQSQDGDFVHVRRHADGLLFSSPAANVRGSAYLSVRGGADETAEERASFWYADGAPPTAGVCAAVGKNLMLTAGKTERIDFSLSFASDADTALLLPALPVIPLPERGSLTVRSADPDFDRMVNTWLPWQIRNCRIEGRTGFYQCGGAWGFRDQLQDVSAFLWLDPPLVRRQILRAAAVQFREGDVLHWWHRLAPGDGGLRGVRTRYRDDLLWLPWLTAAYVRVTGDASVLDIPVPYLDAAPLQAHETERYFSPKAGAGRESLRAHCCRAIDYALQTGAHGLLCIGGGDWNDGFNRAGIEGKGESVWLTQFMIAVLRDFAPLCAADKVQSYLNRIPELTRAVETCWDGDHYLRAYLDDGTPLGKTGDEQCAIDSITQSFAAFSGMRPDRVCTALRTAAERLTDKEKGLVKLLDPPFTGEGKQVGYITAYPPGIRENGGQYTHAAVWLCRAMLQNDMHKQGFALFQMLNPAHFCADGYRCAAYGGEPYALAGDIPAADRHVARTGWSLYTGSAAWMYRTAVETILGVHVENGELWIEPHLVPEILPISLKIQVNHTVVTVHIDRADSKELCENGKKIARIPLDGGVHSVELR